LRKTAFSNVMALNLDDVDTLRSIDRSNMLSLMEKTAERLTPPLDANATCGKGLQRPQNVVFAGVGGSAIVGDILADYARDMIDIPVLVSRTMRLPSFVCKQTLFVAVSYSGETRETLAIRDQAESRGATIVTISSGGRLLSRAKEEGLPHLEIQAGLLPRVALPELLAAAVFVLGSASLLEDPLKLLSDARRSVSTQIDVVKPTIPTRKNSAKQMAQVLLDRLPLIVGSEENASVLRRFKNELNENSKMPAFYYTLPESYHDDVEGLRTLRNLANVQPVFLEGDNSPAQIRTEERLKALLEEIGFPKIVSFTGMGQDRLSQLLTAVVFGDYVSIYLAGLRCIDPSEMRLIPEFRKVMQGA
jgi:glucose/mannose-6-phosphate isomerase